MSSPTEPPHENPSSLIDSLQQEIQTLRTKVAAVDKERVQYLQNVAHQIVAPLNAMKWHIENLSNGRLGVDRAKKVLRSIYSQATIAVHLAKNFALMSNLEEDHALSALREPLEPVDLKRLLINIADDFQPLGWDKSIQIGVNDPSFEGVPEVLSIKPLISQVFSNIVENAVKYSDENTSIVVRGSYNSADDVATVSILNTGLRVGPDEEQRIFERSYRGAAAKTKYPAGTGFGLYIAKKIVEIHEGSIRAHTDQSTKRTIFDVALPTRKLKGKTKEWSKKQSS
jgi:signal transduction histidine kinase